MTLKVNQGQWTFGRPYIVRNDRSHAIWPSTVAMPLAFTVYETQRDTCGKSSIFPTPRVFGYTAGVTPSEFHQTHRQQKTSR